MLKNVESTDFVWFGLLKKEDQLRRALELWIFDIPTATESSFVPRCQVRFLKD